MTLTGTARRRSRGLAGSRSRSRCTPGFVVYNPDDRCFDCADATGPNLGCNFDPSHLFWQGIDPVVAIRVLAEDDAIFHVHAKDTVLNWRVNQPQGRP